MGPTLGLVGEQVSVDELGRKGALGVGDASEGGDKVPDVVGDRRDERQVAILAEVAHPVDRVDAVRLGLRAEPPGVPGDGGRDLVDVDEDRDRVRVALSARHVAVRARHGAAVRGGRCDEVGRAPVRAHAKPLFDAEHEDLALQAQPVRRELLVGEELGDLPVARDLDELGVGKAGQHLAAALVSPHCGFEIDPFRFDEAPRKRHKVDVGRAEDHGILARSRLR